MIILLGGNCISIRKYAMIEKLEFPIPNKMTTMLLNCIVNCNGYVTY